MSYEPDADAVPININSTRLLSQRDLSLNIPVNFVDVTGVSLTAACFFHQRYEDNAVSKCVSNLLAAGFARFEVDLYWDATRQLWSLCPIELGDREEVADVSTFVITSYPTALPTASLNNESAITGMVGRDPLPHFSKLDLFPLDRNLRRQDGDDPESESSSSSSAGAEVLDGESLAEPVEPSRPATLSSTLPATTNTLTLNGTNNGQTVATSTQTAVAPLGTLVEAGPYACTTSVNLDLLTTVFLDYITETNYDVNATLSYLILNVHAAVSAADPDGSAQTPPEDQMPESGTYLSSFLARGLSSYIYTPQDLDQQRMNLNQVEGWYNSIRASDPIPAYMSMDGEGDSTSTPDGWPSEGYVKMEKAKRLFAGFGSIDPQMRRYDQSSDESWIFPPAYIQSSTPFTIRGNDEVEPRCYYNEDTDTVSGANNSWAVFPDQTSTYGVSINANFSESINSTACGITPILNRTLGNTTADRDYRPYDAYVQNLIWSWAEGEPQLPPDTSAQRNTENSCAVLDADTGYWYSEDCSGPHHVACRRPRHPYMWSVSDNPTSYTKAEDACDDETRFTAPRTALENTYLLNHWRANMTARDIEDSRLWLDVNDLDTPGCWVLGANSTCPYSGPDDGVRRVIVPVVAGVIVFVLAILTVCVKCAGNRQRSKRRRKRGDDGWDYEGVPS